MTGPTPAHVRNTRLVFEDSPGRRTECHETGGGAPLGVAVNLDDMLMRVHPGDGFVARQAGIALVVFASGAAQDRTADELLALVEAASNGAGAPGRRLARQVARLVGDADPDDVPSPAATSPGRTATSP